MRSSFRIFYAPLFTILLAERLFTCIVRLFLSGKAPIRVKVVSSGSIRYFSLFIKVAVRLVPSEEVIIIPLRAGEKPGAKVYKIFPRSSLMFHLALCSQYGIDG